MASLNTIFIMVQPNFVVRGIESVKNNNKLKELLKLEKERNKMLGQKISKLESSIKSIEKEKVENIIKSLNATDWVNKGNNTDDNELKIENYSIAIKLDSLCIFRLKPATQSG